MVGLTMFRLFRRATSGALRPVSYHLGCDHADALRRAVECGCVKEDEIVTVIALGDIVERRAT